MKKLELTQDSGCKEGDSAMYSFEQIWAFGDGHGFLDGEKLARLSAEELKRLFESVYPDYRVLRDACSADCECCGGHDLAMQKHAGNLVEVSELLRSKFNIQVQVSDEDVISYASATTEC